MPDPIRLCPNCQQSRSLNELYCEGLINNTPCGWSLFDVPISYPESQQIPDSQAPTGTVLSSRQCENGHPATDDDFICMECGADIAEAATDKINLPAPEVSASLTQEIPFTKAQEAHPLIDVWQVEKTLQSHQENRQCFLVSHTETGIKGFLVLHPEGHKTDLDIYAILKNTDHDHIPRLLATGDWKQRFYEVHEHITEGSLSHHAYFSVDAIESVIKEIAKSLHALSGMGIRHRNINPDAVLIRTQEPLDLVITDFSSARLSDFDLETVAPLTLSRYSAPETIVGTVSIASDWWSLGIILLEQLTQGECFSGVNDKAFMMQVVTRDVDIPESIPANLRHLLSGLLVRDPQQRWHWDELKQWLDGNPPPAPQRRFNESRTQNSIQLNEHAINSPEQFALLAAQTENWQAGNELFIQGHLATWCDQNLQDPTIGAQLRRLLSDQDLETKGHSETETEISQDFKYSLALMVLNPSIPLSYRGDIITPPWLLPNAILSYRLLNSRIIDYLQEMEREHWLVSLKFRLEAIRKRAKLLDIALDESKFQISVLATSRANLDAEYSLLREIYPDANHAGLLDLLNKSYLKDDDLILLLSAQTTDFTPLDEIIQEAESLAKQHDILVFDSDTARQQLLQTRSQLYQQLSEISADFSRCGHAILDGWVDDFRLESRLKLTRILVLLSLPNDQWVKPEKQKYLNNLFTFFEKRVINNILRGSLVRLTISKNTAKIDLTELETGLRSASSLLEHILDRGDSAIPIDPSAYRDKPVLDRRLNNTIQQARIYRQETGIDSLYIGFPFLLRQETHKTMRPRVAPLLLWPVSVEQDEHYNYSLRFARERETVRLNPALEGFLPSDEYQKLKDIRQSLLRRNDINIQILLDNFGSLYPARDNQLVSHPKVDLKLASGDNFIEPSAVLFNATFVGQSISEDLRNLRQLPIQDTALEAAFQLDEASENSPLEPVAESDKYFITAADPSQEKAILQSRQAPGLLIEGPPGTGKSQTIVNIISDCVGRKEKVLVICQKHAALQVVAKRLEARGLQNRFFMIDDIHRDRQSTIRTLRNQLGELKGITPSPPDPWKLDDFIPPEGDSDIYRAVMSLRGEIPDKDLKQRSQTNTSLVESQRNDIAQKIDRIEAGLNDYHHSLYQIDSSSQHSYRHVLSKLITLESQSFPLIDIPQLRSLLEDISPNELNTLQEKITPLASAWLESNYESSPLTCLKLFSLDSALLDSITDNFSNFYQQEKQRSEILESVISDFDDGEHAPYQQWLNKYAKLFQSLDKAGRQQIAQWFSLFDDEVNSQSEGADLLYRLEALQPKLTALDDYLYDALYSPALQNSRTDDIRRWSKLSSELQKPRSFLSWLNPFYFLKNKKLNKLQKLADIDVEDKRLEDIEAACQLELACRPLRKKISQMSDTLAYSNELEKLSLKELRRYLQQLIDALQSSHKVSHAVFNCPRKKEARQFVLRATESAYDGFFNKLKAAITRALSRQKSQQLLHILSPWFEETWQQQRQSEIDNNGVALKKLEQLSDGFPNAKSYQYFRLNTQKSSERLFEIFKLLRDKEPQLHRIDSAELGLTLSHNIQREALLSWKDRMERQHPVLLMSQREAHQKIQQLTQASEAILDATQEVLHRNIDQQRLANDKQWESITRLRGIRYKRLREFIDEGMDMGLMELRPVWLMNPEVASQALPLKANLFDVVIYDEASQLMVDYAIPTLYRAKRAIISGDEKQMPPTSFFSSKISSNEDASLLELDDDLSENEKIQQEEAWSRHEIKDQSDLLSLGRTFLPSDTLQIHYRSRYESLIKFSNHAFYNGQLNVPSKHPTTELLRAKPLEVIQVDGVYSEQTNLMEAQQIVATIAEYWQQNRLKRPSIGVVTFNKKQAALIEDTLREYAAEHDDFSQAYNEEINRVYKGEETGFFVKNVENVQGDERDIMLFSTTFGCDPQGRFYRRFGALGQVGGERRLNVAITRAKEKVILVTSMPVEKISDALTTHNLPEKPRDYLQLYLDFANKISNGEINNANLSVQRLSHKRKGFKPQSKQDGFVQSIADYLASEGYQSIAATDNDDSFQLDLAIEDASTGLFSLGIECDSPQHSLLAQASAREIWRPAVLKQSVGQLHRINSRDWYHDRETEQQRLLDAVTQSLKKEDTAEDESV